MLDSVAIQPIKNFEDISADSLAKMLRNQMPVEPINPEHHLPFIFGNDADSIDVATRVAMVRWCLIYANYGIEQNCGSQMCQSYSIFTLQVNFLMSPNLLENFDEHTRVIRLYQRPIVTIKTSTLIKGLKDSPFLKQFSTTQVFIQLIYSMLSGQP